MDHCVCNGSTLVDTGALTNFWYFFQPREEIYGLLESVCGARLTVSACRIGGLIADLPPDFVARCRRLLEIIPPFIDDVEKLVDKNRIFLDRAVGVAAISGEDAVNWGWTGPCLRASGVAYDVRKAHPYDLYDTVDWDVPVLYGGDVYDRFRVRMLEIRQSLRIIRQLLDRGMPAGPVHRRRPARRAAAEGGLLQPDGVHDLPLQADHGRHPGAAGRELRHGRRRQRRARLLLRLATAPASRTACTCGRPASRSSRPSPS